MESCSSSSSSFEARDAVSLCTSVGQLPAALSPKKNLSSSKTAKEIYNRYSMHKYLQSKGSVSTPFFESSPFKRASEDEKVGENGI